MNLRTFIAAAVVGTSILGVTGLAPRASAQPAAAEAVKAGVVETSATARGREIVLYDEAGRFSMRLEGLTSSVLTRPASVGSMRTA